MNFIKKLLLLMVFMSIVGSSASAEPKMRAFLEKNYPNGGVISYFLDKVEYYRKHQIQVVIDGRGCASSCTLFTNLLKDGLICALPSARFTFHKYHRPADNRKNSKGQLISRRLGRPYNKEEMRIMMRWYPTVVKTRFGQLGERLPEVGSEVVLTPRQLGIPICNPDTPLS